MVEDGIRAVVEEGIDGGGGGERSGGGGGDQIGGKWIWSLFSWAINLPEGKVLGPKSPWAINLFVGVSDN